MNEDYMRAGDDELPFQFSKTGIRWTTFRQGFMLRRLPTNLDGKVIRNAEDMYDWLPKKSRAPYLSRGLEPEEKRIFGGFGIDYGIPGRDRTILSEMQFYGGTWSVGDSRNLPLIHNEPMLHWRYSRPESSPYQWGFSAIFSPVPDGLGAHDDVVDAIGASFPVPHSMLYSWDAPSQWGGYAMNDVYEKMVTAINSLSNAFVDWAGVVFPGIERIMEDLVGAFYVDFEKSDNPFKRFVQYLEHRREHPIDWGSDDWQDQIDERWQLWNTSQNYLLWGINGRKQETED